MAKTVRLSVDLPPKTHERFFKRCKFDLGNISMNKRVLQLVLADLAGKIDVPHEPEGADDEGKR